MAHSRYGFLLYRVHICFHEYNYAGFMEGRSHGKNWPLASTKINVGILAHLTHLYDHQMDLCRKNLVRYDESSQIHLKLTDASHHKVRCQSRKIL